MPRFTLTKSVAAPPADVYAVFTDLDRLPAHIPGIKKIERVTPGPFGVGTTFRETRVMFGREATETFEAVAVDPGRAFTLRAMSCGSEFVVEHRFVPDGAGTRVEMEVTMRAVSLFARLMSPLGRLMAGTMKKAIAGDLDKMATAAATRG